MTPRAARGISNGAAQATRAPRLGERLRQLRVAAGLTQTDIAGDRFSKEYISQIERGKTRPTSDTIEWLAMRLGVDAGFLQSGVSADERAKAECMGSARGDKPRFRVGRRPREYRRRPTGAPSDQVEPREPQPGLYLFLRPVGGFSSFSRASNAGALRARAGGRRRPGAASRARASHSG